MHTLNGKFRSRKQEEHFLKSPKRLENSFIRQAVTSRKGWTSLTFQHDVRQGKLTNLFSTSCISHNRSLFLNDFTDEYKSVTRASLLCRSVFKAFRWAVISARKAGLLTQVVSQNNAALGSFFKSRNSTICSRSSNTRLSIFHGWASGLRRSRRDLYI